MLVLTSDLVLLNRSDGIPKRNVASSGFAKLF